MRRSRDNRYLSHEIGTATTTWYSSPLYCDECCSDMVSDNCGLINVALTESLIIPATNVHSDRVSDNSGSDKCGPDKCGPDKCSFDMVSDMVSDNPGSDKHGSDKCALTRSDNPSCDKWIPALLGSEGDLVEPTSPSEPPRLNLRSNESFILWIKEYIIWLSKLALTSVALTCAALTWSLTTSLTTSLTLPALINMALTFPALINMALAGALWHDLTVPAAINVTDKCDSDMDSGSDWLRQGAKGGTRY